MQNIYVFLSFCFQGKKHFCVSLQHATHSHHTRRIQPPHRRRHRRARPARRMGHGRNRRRAHLRRPHVSGAHREGPRRSHRRAPWRLHLGLQPRAPRRHVLRRHGQPHSHGHEGHGARVGHIPRRVRPARRRQRYQPRLYARRPAAPPSRDSRAPRRRRRRGHEPQPARAAPAAARGRGERPRSRRPRRFPAPARRQRSAPALQRPALRGRHAGRTRAAQHHRRPRATSPRSTTTTLRPT